jgi:hypothetical protein
MRIMGREFILFLAERCSRFAVRSVTLICLQCASRVSQRRGYNI